MSLNRLNRKNEMKNMYLPDANSLALTAIEKAKMTATIEQMREEGASVEEVAEAIIDKETAKGIAENIIQMATIMKMSQILEVTREQFQDSQVWHGYCLLMQHYIHHPDAIAHTKVFNKDSTFRTVWTYLLTGIEFDPPENFSENVNNPYFQKILDLNMYENWTKFGFSENHAKFLHKNWGKTLDRLLK